MARYRPSMRAASLTPIETLLGIIVVYRPSMIAAAMDPTAAYFCGQKPVREKFVLDATLFNRDNAIASAGLSRFG